MKGLGWKVLSADNQIRKGSFIFNELLKHRQSDVLCSFHYKWRRLYLNISIPRFIVSGVISTAAATQCTERKCERQGLRPSALQTLLPYDACVPFFLFVTQSALSNMLFYADWELDTVWSFKVSPPPRPPPLLNQTRHCLAFTGVRKGCVSDGREQRDQL